MFVACGPTQTLNPFAVLPATALVAVLSGIVVKSYLSKWVAPSPPAGRTVLLTVLEPFLYAVSIVGAIALVEEGWGWTPQIIHPLAGLGVAFVTIAGLHGRFLGCTQPDISERRRLWLSVLYALPLPASLAALWALVAIGVVF